MFYRSARKFSENQIDPVSIKNSVFSDGDDKSLNKNMLNGFEDYSIKHQGYEYSVESGESEFPNAEDSLHIRLIYDKNKFIS